MITRVTVCTCALLMPMSTALALYMREEDDTAGSSVNSTREGKFLSPGLLATSVIGNIAAITAGLFYWNGRRRQSIQQSVFSSRSKLREHDRQSVDLLAPDPWGTPEARYNMAQELQAPGPTTATGEAPAVSSFTNLTSFLSPEEEKKDLKKIFLLSAISNSITDNINRESNNKKDGNSIVLPQQLQGSAKDIKKATPYPYFKPTTLRPSYSDRAVPTTLLPTEFRNENQDLTEAGNGDHEFTESGNGDHDFTDFRNGDHNHAESRNEENDQYYDSEASDYENFEPQRLSSVSQQLLSDQEPRQRSSEELEADANKGKKSAEKPSAEDDENSLTAEMRSSKDAFPEEEWDEAQDMTELAELGSNSLSSLSPRRTGLPSLFKPPKSYPKIPTATSWIKKPSQYQIDNYDDSYDYYDPTNVMDQLGDLLKEKKPSDLLKEEKQEISLEKNDQWRTIGGDEATGGQLEDIMKKAKDTISKNELLMNLFADLSHLANMTSDGNPT